MAGLPPCVNEKARDGSGKTHRLASPSQKSQIIINQILFVQCDSMYLGPVFPEGEASSLFAHALLLLLPLNLKSHSEKTRINDTRSAPYSLF